MRNFLIDLLAYFKAVFLESYGRVLALFDILGIVMFFQPLFVEKLLKDIPVAREVGLIIFMLSFLIANFALFRKLTPQVLDDRSLRFLRHDKKSNALVMQYKGSQRATDLTVTLSYKDVDGHLKHKSVTQFFPKSDIEMIWGGGPLEGLEIDQEACFKLLSEQETSDGKVTVHVTFTGAKTGQRVKVDRDFLLSDGNDWTIISSTRY